MMKQKDWTDLEEDENDWKVGNEELGGVGGRQVAADRLLEQGRLVEGHQPVLDRLPGFVGQRGSAVDGSAKFSSKVSIIHSEIKRSSDQ